MHIGKNGFHDFLSEPDAQSKMQKNNINLPLSPYTIASLTCTPPPDRTVDLRIFFALFLSRLPTHVFHFPAAKSSAIQKKKCT